jgi:CelD/BcsL family acetyltransferase involved in cellulose biosynthesis
MISTSTTHREPAVAPGSPVLTDEAGLGRLAPEWKRLEALPQNALPFLSFDWTVNWWRRFGAPPSPERARRTLRSVVRSALYAAGGRRRELYVMAGDTAAATDWLAPLGRLTYTPLGISLRCLEFLTASSAGYSDLLLGGDAERQVAAFLHALLARSEEWDCLDLRHFPNDSPTPALLVAAASVAGLRAELCPDGSGPVVPITGTWKEMLQHKSKSARQVFRYQANRLARASARIRVLADPSVEPGLVERMAAVEATKQFRGAPTLRVMAGDEQFYSDLFATLGPQGRLYAALLELDGELAAYEWGFRAASRLLVYNKGYRPEYHRFSPGTMLVPAVLDFGFEQGYKEYDFVRGEEHYKWRWATESRPAWRVRIWRPGFRSALARTVFLRLSPRVERLLSALRIRYVSPWEF